MLGDEHAAGRGMTTVATRLAAVCTMIDEHEAAETTMSARRVAAMSAMIDEVAVAAEASCDGRRRRKRRMGSARCYEEICKLGEGAFGVVVKARHRASGHIVAVKALRSCAERRTPDVGDLLREACFMAAGRGHPSLVGLRGVARTPGTRDYFLVMDYVGPSLLHVLQERMHRGGRPFPEDDVRRVMRQLLTGAEAMHKHCIIHRDIKPENILVGDGGNVVKIGDYGVAVSMAEPEQPYLVAGTMWYMAPEMLLEKPDYDTLVDLWSLVCVMAELLTGKVLFEGEDETDQLYKIFDVLGVPGKRAWKAFKSELLADEVQLWRRRAQRRRVRHHNRLRELFPEELLSKDGFEVLKGLLTCHPNKRLTAAAALQCPWFTDSVDTPAVSKIGTAARKAWSLVWVLIGALALLWKMVTRWACAGVAQAKALLK